MIAVLQYIFESWLWSVLGLVVGYLLGRAERTVLGRLDKLDEEIHAHDERGAADDHA